MGTTKMISDGLSILFFDTETDSLVSNSARDESKQPKIIEFFGLSVTDDDHTEHQMMFNIGHPIPEEVTKITNITNDMVVGAPKFSEHAEGIKSLIESHDLVVAHNLSFDKTVVDIEMKRLGMNVNWPMGICTVEQTEWLKGFRLSLTALHEELFGEGFGDAHRAKNDVMALHKCYVELERKGIL
jgi:DNA polymerase-3 subunit epsilon